MTAEIAVMNKGAIALAADSKVTVTSGGVTKTYDTVSKLFTLSKTAPVGVMIYGNAEFMGYPWETIIKEYRNRIGKRSHRFIRDWADDFFEFVGEFGNISADDKNENVKNICLSTISGAANQYEEIAQSQNIAHGSDAYEQGLAQYLRYRTERISGESSWLPPRQQKVLAKQLAENIVQAIETHLKGYSDQTKEAGVLFLVATLILTVSSPQISGIVIAGFGDHEYFPSLVEFKTDGYVGSKIKIFQVPPEVDLSRTSPACIRAFAQHEMVQRFMNGIDPAYSSYLGHAIPELVMDNCFATLEKYGSRTKKTDKVKGEIEAAVKKSVSEFDKDSQEYLLHRFAQPVIRMVAVLPKDELAHLAESLVALTSLKRRVSSDAETVGGPIDVALISKGDGFIWIKRKHYFQEELNRQFVRTYMDGINHEERDNAKRGPAKGRRGAAKA